MHCKLTLLFLQRRGTEKGKGAWLLLTATVKYLHRWIKQVVYVQWHMRDFAMRRGVYRGEVDATCVQFGSRGKEFHPRGRGRIPPDIWVILMIVL